MKRQRVVSNVTGFEAAEMAKKKKPIIGKAPVAMKAADQKAAVTVRMNADDAGEAKKEVAVGTSDQETVTGNNLANWDEKWPDWIGDFVDEQMSWGSVWFPFWGMDFSDGEAFGAFYGDVVWDDDIWDLKKEIPNPLQY